MGLCPDHSALGRDGVPTYSQNHRALSTTFSNGSSAANRRAFSSSVAKCRSAMRGDAPATCGVRMTLSIRHNGCSAGSSSVSKTSRPHRRSLRTAKRGQVKERRFYDIGVTRALFRKVWGNLPESTPSRVLLKMFDEPSIAVSDWQTVSDPVSQLPPFEVSRDIDSSLSSRLRLSAAAERSLGFDETALGHSQHFSTVGN